jgi:hypothetical protein
VRQANGNILEFFSDPELQELTLWETGPISSAGPVFARDDGGPISILEAYLSIVPSDAPVPEDLVRFGQVDSDPSKPEAEGRRMVRSVDAPIDVGNHLVAAPSVCNSGSVGWGLDWGPTHRFSGCNVDATVRYMKARLCNTSNWGSLRVRLGHKLSAWWNNFDYPGYRTKDVGPDQYAYVVVNSGLKLKRRAQYTNWSAYYESGWVGGIVDSGSITTDHCSF